MRGNDVVILLFIIEIYTNHKVSVNVQNKYLGKIYKKKGEVFITPLRIPLNFYRVVLRAFCVVGNGEFQRLLG